MQIKQTKRFIKGFLKLDRKIQEKTLHVINTFKDAPQDISLHNHALFGEYSGLRSINITGDYRLIFRELSDGNYELIELIDIGTHSQLYG